MKRAIVALSAIGMLALSACGSDAEPAESTEPAGMANPASEFCAEQGGEIEIVEEADGEVGYCNLPDGTRIEEREYFRSESASASAGIANPASEFCAEQGGEVEIVDEADGEVGYCNLPDGTRIEEWEYFRSES